MGGILQLTTISQLAIFGVPADLSPLLVAAIGLLCGSIAGASFGFGLGLLHGHAAAADARPHLARAARRSATPPGACASCATPPTRWCRWPSGAAATAAAAIGFAVLQFLLGVDAPVSLLLVRQILMTIVLNTLLAMPVYLACRRFLAPYLPDDPRRRRRRAYTTGGLSPLSRA